jgi:hypothetical protein
MQLDSTLRLAGFLNGFVHVLQSVIVTYYSMISGLNPFLPKDCILQSHAHALKKKSALPSP